MNARTHSRRTIALSVVGATAVLYLLHASLSPAPLHSRISTWRSTRTASASPLAIALSAPSETDALPLVAAISSFALTSPSSNATVAICAVPTHEEAFLPEWLTWHRLLGVERFFLFDNAPTVEMRRLLRPWIEEGSVVLYEIDYDESVNIGQIYQTHVIRLCEKYVLPHVKWASHHDVDEFLMVSSPGWAPSVPSLLPSSPAPSPSTDDDALDAPPPPSSPPQWTYPLHSRFNLLDDATCVPMLRLPFHNYGVRELEMQKKAEMVTVRQTVRDNITPNYHTYGKIFLHSDGQRNRAAWMGPHSCKAVPGTIILDAEGKEQIFDRGTYPFAGVPLPQEGLYLNHYIQRSLLDCYSKFHVLSSTPNDWRTQDGLAGCARNYIPSDADLASDASRAALAAEPQGEELVSRPDSWSELMLRDERAGESWQGRMTRAVLEEWRERGGKRSEREGRWWWEYGEGTSDEDLMLLEGVIEVEDVFEEVKGLK